MRPGSFANRSDATDQVAAHRVQGDMLQLRPGHAFSAIGCKAVGLACLDFMKKRCEGRTAYETTLRTKHAALRQLSIALPAFMRLSTSKAGVQQ